jgi:hypothetical protein
VSGVWLGLDVGKGTEAADLEHRTLAAVTALGLDVDHVVTSAPTGHGVPRAVAAIRVRDGAVPGEPGDGSRNDATRAAVHLAERLAARLAGTVAVAPPGRGRERRDRQGVREELDGNEPLVVGDPEAAAICLAAAEAARDGVSGRRVRFPGQDRLTGLVPVRRIVERSAIGRVAASGRPVTDEDVVDTRGFLRPTFEAGQLVLRVGPAAGGLLVPDEGAEPHTCCAGHG